MKIKNFWEAVPLKSYVYASVSLSFLIGMTIVLLKNFLPPQVPLFYGKPTGEEQLVPSLGLIIAPAVSLMVTILNMVLSTLIDDNFLKKVLIISSLFVSIITTITIIKIIFLIGFF